MTRRLLVNRKTEVGNTTSSYSPNVGQYGWVEGDSGLNQLTTYVKEAKEAAKISSESATYTKNLLVDQILPAVEKAEASAESTALLKSGLLEGPLSLRNEGFALRDTISVKDYGAIGDGTLHPVHEWLTSGKFSSLEEIKTKYPRVTSLSDSIDWAAIQTACDVASIKGESVFVPAGVYLFNKTLHHSIYLYSKAPLPSWRSAPFSSTLPEEYDYFSGACFLFVGEGERNLEIKNVTEGRQCGYDRPNPARLYNNEYDAEFTLSDFTNKDAVGNKAATSRKFSAAVVMGTGNYKRPVMGMDGIRIITSCPGTGEVYGWKGYADQTSFKTWAHWDVGVWSMSPLKARLHNCQIVGYWLIRGHLMTTFGTESPESTGYAEFYDIDRCAIQGGTSFRSGDIWPILSKTSSTLTVEWTASHQFPLSGTLNTSNGFISYTGLTYSEENKQLTFTGCSSTDAVATPGTVIRTTRNLGLANARISMSELTDFCHSSRIEEQATAFPQKMPFRGAFEMSGDPARGIALYDTSIYGTGPISLFFGCARDVEMYSCYAEPKGFKQTFDGPSESPGAALIFGPKSTYSNVVPNAYKGRILILGDTFIASANMEPFVKAPAGTRLENGVDYFNPYEVCISRKESYSRLGEVTYTTLKGQRARHRVLSENNSTRYYLECDTNGKTYLGAGFSSSAIDFRASVTTQHSAGGVTRNWGVTDATTGTGYFSDSVLSSGTYKVSYLDADGKELFPFIKLTPSSDKVTANLVLSSTKTFVESSGGETSISSATGSSVRIKEGSSTKVMIGAEEAKFYSTAITPGYDNRSSLGTDSLRWSEVFSGTGTINTSDRDSKTEILPITPEALKAWGEVEWVSFKFKDAVELKGLEEARIHTGLIAQQIVEVFSKHGLDAMKYGVVCYNEWEALPEIRNEEGDIVQEAREAGSLYSVRYQEAEAFEAAYIRSKLDELMSATIRS